MASIIAAAGKAAAHPKVRSCVGKATHKMWKSIRLKNLQCIVVSDHIKNNLGLDLDPEKYRVVVLESVFQSLLSDAEIANLGRLKISSTEAWVLEVKGKLKHYLNSIRWSYRDKQIIIVLSSHDLAMKLHIKNVQVYQMSPDLFETLKAKMDEASLAYYEKHRREHSKVKGVIEFETMHHLEKMLKKSFA